MADRPGQEAVADHSADQPSCAAQIEQLQAALAEAQQLIGNLQIALSTNREIGVAMGILMSRHRINQDQAFTMLRVLSQHTHRKLRDLASDVVFTGMVEPQVATDALTRIRA